MMKGMDINKVINEIIPPDDYQHRNGFSNEHIIDKLSDEDKFRIEAELIDKLRKKPDMLIAETLAYMNSAKSLPLLYDLLKTSDEGMAKLILASSIYRINKDTSMIDIAIIVIRKIDNKRDAYYVHKLTSAFYYLSKFQEPKTTKLLEEYSKHSEYLVSYNAKQALEN